MILQEDLFKNTSECCGCGACVDICPRTVLTMQEDASGFLYPRIMNQEGCIDCKRCLQVCPEKNLFSIESEFKSFYAGYLKNSNELISCASGGLATAISKKFIQTHGIVYGCAYSDDWNTIEYRRATDILDLEKFKTSKYSQSIKNDIYKKIIEDLRGGFKVLFIGLPCDVLAVKSSVPTKYQSALYLLELSTFAQYQFGLTYHLLLLAAQRNGVVSLIQIFTTILNTVVAAILIKAGAGIHIVKLGSALVYALNPLAINIYAKHKFHIIKNVEPDNDAISQRWDAFAHQVAFFVNTNTDIMVLTWFATLKDVSIYSVYYLVINGITIVVKNSIQSVAAAFGDMIAKNEDRLLHENFDAFETMTASISTILFGTTLIMIVPFVSLYTKGVTDANYIQPFFAVLITIAGFFNCIRIPYQNLVEAAGHFKQTKVGAYFEAGMNVLISVICVFKFGLIGVAMHRRKELQFSPSCW